MVTAMQTSPSSPADPAATAAGAASAADAAALGGAVLHPVGNGEGALAALRVATALFSTVSEAVRGKDESVRLALVALLSGSHLLVEDVPGTGKTLLGKSLAAAIGGRFGRVQCTPDLLPSDFTGTSVYSPATGSWDFRPGPVFANVVLVDEVNRASPRTQAALLEPMEERQVTVDGATHALPDPCFMIATQNPLGTTGTFPLPESQLDRFGIVLTMGLPGRDAEREILTGAGGATVLPSIDAVTTPMELRAVIAAVRGLYCAPPVLEYVLDAAAAVRAHPEVVLGASPRATLAMFHAAQAHATICRRHYVVPDDVKAVAPAVLAHRLVFAAGVDVASGNATVREVLDALPVPRP
jgi:MoxR-like ATPase